MSPELARQLAYIVASILFIFGLKMMSSPVRARKGNIVSAVGMLIAIIATCTQLIDFKWIILGSVVGTIIGALAARFVKMTSMPEMVALFNGFGGLASLLVGWAEFHGPWSRVAVTASKLGSNPVTQQAAEFLSRRQPHAIAIPTFTMVAILFTLVIGAVTFSGSMVAYGKLAGKINGKPILFSGQQVVNGVIVSGIVILGVIFASRKIHLLQTAGLMNVYYVMIGLIILALILGILSTIPIGGADMPVVVCLLNSYSGLAACAAGFVINNSSSSPVLSSVPADSSSPTSCVKP